MSYYYEKTYDVYREQVRRARKRHKCDACNLPILPGHYYCSVTWVCDGTARGVKRCGSCQVTHKHLRELCRKYSEGDRWPNERLSCGESYEEEWGDCPDDIAALALMSVEGIGSLLAPKEQP